MRYEVHDECQKICQDRWPLENECKWDKHPFWRVLLIFEQNELKSDIGDEAFVQGDTAVEAEKFTRAAMHNWMDVVEDDNMPRVTRMLKLAATEIEHILHKLTRNVIHGHRAYDNEFRREFEYLVELKVPKTASETSITHLRDLCHEYMISKVLHEWAGKTCPEFKDHWAEKLQMLTEEIKSTGDLCENHKVKRKMWPAW